MFLYRLIKKLLKIITSKLFLTGFMVLLEIILLSLTVLYLGEKQTFVLVALEIISILTAFIILNSQYNPAYKLSFIILVLIVPFVGVTLYYAFGRQKKSRKTIKKIELAHKLSSQFLVTSNKVTDNIDANKAANFIYKTTKMPLFDNTSTKLLTPGETMFNDLVINLKSAKKFIFLEYFIISPGIMWNTIFDILCEKVKENVEVRVIYDDFACINKIPLRFKKNLINNGIKVLNFNPYSPRAAGMLNYRDHRKITVIDGNIGYLGGINLADEYINAVSKFGYWKDASVRLVGEGVYSLTTLFLQMWDISFGEEDFSLYKPDMDSYESDGYVQVFGDSAFNDEEVNENMYINIINSAKKYVYMTSPYLIIDNELMTALKIAAKSGIDVKIMTPHIPDKKIIFAVTRSYYKELIEAGVHIYEYLPGFLHAKTIVADGDMAMIGTSNLDYRSLYLHFEVTSFMYNTKATKEIEEDFLLNLEQAKEITKEECKRTNFFMGLILFFLKVFTPML